MGEPKTLNATDPDAPGPEAPGPDAPGSDAPGPDAPDRDAQGPGSAGLNIVRNGLLTRAELLRRGMNDRELRAAVRSGGLVRVTHGVYARPARGPEASRRHSGAATAVRTGSNGRPVDPAERERRKVDRYRETVRAVAIRGDDPLISHQSAAALYGFALLQVDLSRVHITGACAAGGQRRGSVFRHDRRGTLDEQRLDGVRVTGPARTLVDLARTTDFPTAVAAMDDALHRELVTVADLVNQVADAVACTGISIARRAVDFADARCESAGESLTRTTLRALGFPSPDLQVTVRDASARKLARCDFGYREWGLLIEFDGLVKYGGLANGPDARTAIVDEKRREDRIRRAGFVVLRLTWRDIMDPERLRTLVLEAIEQGRAAVSAGLVTGTLTVEPR